MPFYSLGSKLHCRFCDQILFLFVFLAVLQWLQSHGKIMEIVKICPGFLSGWSFSSRFVLNTQGPSGADGADGAAGAPVSRLARSTSLGIF